MLVVVVESSRADRASVTAPRRPDSYGAGKTILLTLVVLPLFAVPTYLLGQGIADSFDDDPTNGVLALGLMLGVTAPSLLSIFLARVWSELPWIAALALGVGSGLASMVVLLAAFGVYCSAANSIVLSLSAMALSGSDPVVVERARSASRPQRPCRGQAPTCAERPRLGIWR